MRYTLLVAGALVAGCTRAPSAERAAPVAPRLTSQTSGTGSLLQAVSVVDERIVWASGHEGAVVRTVDGGTTWRRIAVPDADSLQFRDIHAVNDRVAWIMAAGPGDRSRILKTTDGGAIWATQFVNREPRAFYDCMAFWDASRGIAVSDAVDGRFPVLVTIDGGARWELLPDAARPEAQAGEGGFAASGTCLTTARGGRAWFGTGSGATARVLLTSDYGRSWSTVTTPLAGGDATGIMALAFHDALRGAALGGKLGETAPRDVVALTADGGRSWTLGGRPRLAGPVYGAVAVPGSEQALVAVGPGGADYSLDGGRSWVALDTAAYWSVGFASPAAGWLVGPGGRITRVALR